MLYIDSNNKTMSLLPAFVREGDQLIPRAQIGEDWSRWAIHGIHQAVPITREPYTTYETEWVKGDDLIYREDILTSVVDEGAVAQARIAEIEAALAALDTYLPRSVEDLIDSGAVAATNLSTYNQTRLQTKTDLRTELAGLQT